MSTSSMILTTLHMGQMIESGILNVGNQMDNVYKLLDGSDTWGAGTSLLSVIGNFIVVVKFTMHIEP